MKRVRHIKRGSERPGPRARTAKDWHHIEKIKIEIEKFYDNLSADGYGEADIDSIIINSVFSVLAMKAERKTKK